MTSLWLDGSTPAPGAPFQADSTADDVVVGAGLTGLITAVLLSRAGRTVAVIEARQPGAVTTGHSTAKLSVLQGTLISRIRKHHSVEVARGYVDGNVEGQQWLLRYCEEHEVPVQHRAAYTYATGTSGAARVNDEFAATRQVGLDTLWVDQPEELPFKTTGAVMLDNQAQFDPMDVIGALTTDLEQRGVRLHHGVRMLGVETGTPCRVHTTAGTMSSERVVLATGIPTLDRGLYFAKLVPQRSYALAVDGVPDPPQSMYLSADEPNRSLRVAPRPEGDRLLIGGAGHTVGRARSERAHLQELREWATEQFPTSRETHWWSAQDYSPVDGVPFVGALPRGGGRIYLATGYSKWGMTNAAAAALRLAAELLGGHLSWADPLKHRITGPRPLIEGLAINAQVALHLATGWTATALRTTPIAPPAEGVGVVGRDGATPTAVSTVDGRTCAVSAVCTHLRGIVTWNDAERSWDCPLHGSRFAPDGAVLEGPATRPLALASTVDVQGPDEPSGQPA